MVVVEFYLVIITYVTYLKGEIMDKLVEKIKGLSKAKKISGIIGIIIILLLLIWGISYGMKGIQGDWVVISSNGEEATYDSVNEFYQVSITKGQIKFHHKRDGQDSVDKVMPISSIDKKNGTITLTGDGTISYSLSNHKNQLVLSMGGAYDSSNGTRVTLVRKKSSLYRNLVKQTKKNQQQSEKEEKEDAEREANNAARSERISRSEKKERSKMASNGTINGTYNASDSDLHNVKANDGNDNEYAIQKVVISNNNQCALTLIMPDSNTSQDSNNNYQTKTQTDNLTLKYVGNGSEADNKLDLEFKIYSNGKKVGTLEYYHKSKKIYVRYDGTSDEQKNLADFSSLNLNQTLRR